MIIAFIGCGNMASAAISGLLANGVASPADIIAADPFEASREKAGKTFGIRVTCDNKEAAAAANVLVLAVKPDKAEAAIADIAGSLREDALLISFVTGRSCAWLEEQFGRPVHLVRTMPNTPAQVGEGMTALCPNTHVTEDDLALAQRILGSFGKTAVVPEHLLGAVTGLSGSGPAYAFLFIEALADAGVRAGLTRDLSYTLAAQMLLGSAKMVLDTGLHPGVLKDRVCSPGGTTIEAVQVLEEAGFRGAVMDAVQACIEKAESM